MEGWGLRAALVALALLVLAGCGQTAPAGPPTGSAPGTAPSRSAPPGSSAQLGDPTTVDPCSLLDPAAFYRYGRSAQGRPVSLDYCVTTIDTQSGAHLEIAAGELSHVDPANDLTGRDIVPVGALRMVRNPLQQGECTRPLVFTDNIALDVRVDQFAGDTTLDLCEVAETAARETAATIAGGGVGHRQYPAGSLGHLDPCRLMPPAAVQALPGIAGHPAVGAPGGHQCNWGGDDPSQPHLRLLFGAGDPPAVHDNTAAAETIDGRNTVLTRLGGGGGPALCTAETGLLPFGAPGGGSVEVATAVVVLPSGDMDTACADARSAAGAVWPRLPRP